MTVILDDKEWRGFFSKLIFNLNNPLAKLKAGYAIFGYKDIIDHFEKEEGEGGKKWKKRKASTQHSYKLRNKSNKKYNPTNKLLQMTGTLRQSILTGKKTNVKNVGRSGILVFSRVKYGGVHNYGSNKKNIPKREFMWMSERTTQTFADYLANWLSKS